MNANEQADRILARAEFFACHLRAGNTDAGILACTSLMAAADFIGRELQQRSIAEHRAAHPPVPGDWRAPNWETVSQYPAEDRDIVSNSPEQVCHPGLQTAKRKTVLRAELKENRRLWRYNARYPHRREQLDQRRDEIERELESLKVCHTVLQTISDIMPEFSTDAQLSEAAHG